ncbi:MAG: hypothetical protein GX923_00755 [Clostridia bacterium]|nr:hypothetical protein [Clostridia bacterium]
MSKKTKRLKGTYLLLTSILFLNFLGVSYAHWDKSLTINAKITTAEILPRFLNGHVEGGNNGLKIDVRDEHISITGMVEHDYSWSDLQYKIQNKGDIPIKVFLPDKAESHKLYKNDVIKLNVPLEEKIYYEIICEQTID